ncbi:WG repeat-containing protein [Lignipirellula cremea]|uniref:KWG Leptospira n=1 Tax=Lignipirellula cremea TaxID=2528010 RepID=A0A518DS90_9BACT|nr:WG repeat-containing protein [Lignipirellula cremea]QDU94703.1 KWG Leptospira [Lignipirellula cremea]
MYGYIHPDGSRAIDFRYSCASPFDEGLASVCLDGKWGAIDRRGEIVFLTDFEGIGHFSGGFAWCLENGLYGLLNAAGNVLVPPSFSGPVSPMCDGRAKVRLDRKFGYLDVFGNLAVPLRFNAANNFSEGFASVELDSKRCYIDQAGALVFAESYYQTHPFSEGWAGVEDESGAYFLDPTGAVVLRLPQGVYASEFSEGLAAAKFATPIADNPEVYDVEVGYIDRSGETVIEPSFYIGGNFSNGVATVSVDERTYGAIRDDGTWFAEPIYQDVRRYTEERLAVQLNKRFGYLDDAGRQIIKPQYRRARPFSEGLADVEE